MSDLDTLSITPRARYLTRVYVGTTAALVLAGGFVVVSRFTIRVRERLAIRWDDWLIAAGFVSTHG